MALLRYPKIAFRMISADTAVGLRVDLQMFRLGFSYEYCNFMIIIIGK